VVDPTLTTLGAEDVMLDMDDIFVYQKDNRVVLVREVWMEDEYDE